MDLFSFYLQKASPCHFADSLHIPCISCVTMGIEPWTPLRFISGSFSAKQLDSSNCAKRSSHFHLLPFRLISFKLKWKGVQRVCSVSKFSVCSRLSQMYWKSFKCSFISREVVNKLSPCLSDFFCLGCKKWSTSQQRSAWNKSLPKSRLDLYRLNCISWQESTLFLGALFLEAWLSFKSCLTSQKWERKN